jgi:hypothetical protein
MGLDDLTPEARSNNGKTANLESNHAGTASAPPHRAAVGLSPSLSMDEDC